MIPSDVPRRRNGLSAPYSAPQITSWLFLAATAIHFVLFISPILPLGASIALTLFFFILVGLVCYYGIRAIAMDSMDLHLHQAMVEHRNGEIKKESNFLNRLYTMYNGSVDQRKEIVPPDNEETKQCWICDTQVADHSMHCKYCNKCVSHFDHHCLWLNTCIGEKNYRDFFRVMISIAVMQIVHVAISLGLIVDIFIHGPTEKRADDWLGSSNASPAVAAVLIFFVIFDACSLILLAQLILFHIHLQKQRITTYQYIVQDSQKRRDKGKLIMRLDQQRKSEVTRAQEEKRSWYAFRLKSGAKFREWHCACLDPLKLPQPDPEPDPNDGFGAALGAPVVSNGNGHVPVPEQPGEIGDGEEALEANETNTVERDVENEVAPADAIVQESALDDDADDDPGITFLPVVNGGGMTDERHELDSLPSQSDLGDPDMSLDIETPADAVTK